MESNNKFNANGQLLFVDADWITGKTCLFTVTDMHDYIKGMMGLTKIRKDFLKRLEDEGFVITTDKKDTTSDIVCFTMNDNAINMDGSKIEDYKKMFDQRMFEAGGEKLNYPYSLSMEEYFKNPFYPAVFKNESTNGGKDKFLIETPEQVEVIKRFYDRYKNARGFDFAFSCSIFQQFIQTPTDHKTYMRVLMSTSGDVMGASLKYSIATYNHNKSKGLFDNYFLNKDSEYYLNCSDMFNYYSGGGDINLGKTRFTSYEKEILSAHGINPENPSVPEEVLEVSANIASSCNKELGIICGIDFILDETTNKWYYLEIQAFPAVSEWAIAKKKKPVVVRNINDYIKLNAQDLEARYEALMMFMEKKKKLEDSKKLSRIKPE